MQNTLDSEAYSIYVHSVARNVGRTEQLILAERIARGNADGLDDLVTPYLAFALECSEAYQHKVHRIGSETIPLKDLIKLANEGLRTGAAAYAKGDGKNYDFKEYIHWWIRQYLGRAR